MHVNFVRVLVVGLVVTTLGWGRVKADLAPQNLTCEYGVDPLGIDVPQPRLSWKLTADERGQHQSAWQVQVASSSESLAQDKADLWDSGKQPGDQSTFIAYEGTPLGTSQQVFWRVRVWDGSDVASDWTNAATWTMGVMRPEDWQAEWIVAPQQSESLLLRKRFDAGTGVQRAVLHVCGLGFYEAYLNGTKVGDGLIAPGWSKYDQTCLYETHDVTHQLVAGANAIGVALGDGMYHTERRNRFSKFQGSFGPQRLIALLDIVYADGRRERIATDSSWRTSPGPTTYTDIYGGEDYDARREESGWATAKFDDSHWSPGVVLVRPKGVLRGYTFSAPPIKAIETREPVAVRTLSPAMDVVDLGQNASYMPRITVVGPAGSTVRLTHAEVVRSDGTIDRDTCGGNRGPAYWQYTKATDDAETWFPRFFYSGCRYLQVDKLPAEEGGDLPQLAKLEGVVVHSTAPAVGTFACSNETLNRIHTLLRWAQRSNMVSVLTDCPHREKLGWLEQYHLNGPAITYEFDVAKIYIKSLRDMADSQTETGLIPNIAPEYVKFDGTFRAAAEWAAAGVLVPWQHYQFTGDDRLLHDYYPMMQRYVDYLGSKAKEGTIDEGLGDWYDLGPAEHPGGAQLTPPEVTATAFYFHVARTMTDIARHLQRDEDAAKYGQLAESIRQAWQQKFRHDDGVYATRSQTSSALAWSMELAESRDRDAVLAHLVGDIQRNDDATTAGDVGWGYVIRALSDGGENDLLFRVFMNDTKPGYAFILKQGATSLTEAWDANIHSSHNHFMLGQINEWYYQDLLGIRIDPAAPGFKRVIIEPRPCGDLTWAEGSYDSIRGPIRVRWDRQPQQLTLKVEIPPGSTAIVKVPKSPGQSLSEGGQPVANAEGVTGVSETETQFAVDVAAGRYEFKVE